MDRRELLGILPGLWLARGAAAQDQANIQLQELSDHLTLLSGAGGNIAVLEGPDGLLIVDSGLPQHAEAVEAKARSVGPGAITVLINTHFHSDHVGGNARLGSAGARIIAHENVLKRVSAVHRSTIMNREIPPLPPEGRPKSTFAKDGNLAHGTEKVLYKYLPPAHTDGDTTITFANANVYHAGDLFFNGMYPSPIRR